MVTYLLTDVSKVFSYKLVSLSKMRVERLFVPDLGHVQLRQVMTDG